MHGSKQSQIANRTIFGLDNLDVLRGMNTETIDLIYLDPPFNKKKTFIAPVGSSAEGASFKDIFRNEDLQSEWLETIKEDHKKVSGFLNAVQSFAGSQSGNAGNAGSQSYNYCYLTYMAIRIIEMHRILKQSGSLYLHCDTTMSHYLKLLLDCIFGEENFRNEIVWHYNSGARGKAFGKRHDIIFFYTKTAKFIFNQDAVRTPYSPNINIPASKAHYYHPLGKVHDDVFQIKIIAQNDKKERLGYPTQKPLALLDRIIRASSQKGDVVLDPFCGCATTCIAAERLARQWIGIDISAKAYELVRLRLKKEVADPEELFDFEKDLHFRETPPVRLPPLESTG